MTSEEANQKTVREIRMYCEENNCGALIENGKITKFVADMKMT